MWGSHSDFHEVEFFCPRRQFYSDKECKTFLSKSRESFTQQRNVTSQKTRILKIPFVSVDSSILSAQHILLYKIRNTASSLSTSHCTSGTISPVVVYCILSTHVKPPWWRSQKLWQKIQFLPYGRSIGSWTCLTHKMYIRIQHQWRLAILNQFSVLI
jgi:hypothetical protein